MEGEMKMAIFIEHISFIFYVFLFILILIFIIFLFYLFLQICRFIYDEIIGGKNGKNNR